ncbi:hypothetical protein BGX21_010303 [Mortierella sp. AD011]|nr:hypothetical protein BGX20_002095 [Mortierella sp. AD010]KAF9394574.1 hypothetical protein BGX21_010303 [Mortierella sp. AD011]
MRFATAATLLTLASSAFASSWKYMGGDLGLVGPAYNATFKAGDVIPLEYAFYTPKIVSLNTTTSTNSSTSVNTGTASITSLAWIGETGNQTLNIAFNNDRSSGLASTCLSTDLCTGTYYPKRIDLTIPSDVYPSNYTIVVGYTLTVPANITIYYKEPVIVVASTANVTSPTAVYPGAPSVQATLPVYAAPSSNGLVNQVPKTVVGMTIMLASAMLML